MKNLKETLELIRIKKHEKKEYREKGYDILDSENWYSLKLDRSFKTLAEAKKYIAS